MELTTLSMGAEQSQTQVEERNFVSFTINQKLFEVRPESDGVDAEMKLVDFIRDRAFFKGTKFCCREGGCGICAVNVRFRDPHTMEETNRTVNSCLVPVFACDGWEIRTVESVGSSRTGLHPIQERFVQFQGSQCGFCTPGWIMNFHTLLESSKEVRIKDIEDVTDSNLCRCTGYRPIVDAIRSLAVDAPENLKREAMKCSLPNVSYLKSAPAPDNLRNFHPEDSMMVLEPQRTPPYRWVRAVNLQMVFMTIQRFQGLGIPWRFMGGNTSAGVYKNKGDFVGFIDINSVESLRKIQVQPTSMDFGGAVTFTRAIKALEGSANIQGFEYFVEICKHWKNVANNSIRNCATLGGNLMLKHQHREFPSDIFTVLEAVGCMVTIASSPSLLRKYSTHEFLQLNDVTGKLVHTVHLPKLEKGFQFRSFKIRKRWENSIAILNAAFVVQLDPQTGSIKSKPAIVYGGIAPDFVHATQTEQALLGKSLIKETIQAAMEALGREINPAEDDVLAGSSAYRKLLAQALLYKFLLGLMGQAVDGKLRSGSLDIQRILPTGKQTYEVDASQTPLYDAVNKIEVPLQCTGEVEFVNDISPLPGEAHAAVLMAEFGNAQLQGVDPSEALKLPGVLAWIDHKNIPGENNSMIGMDSDKPDLVFVENKISYAGQPIGVIVADSRDLAYKALKLIRVEYTNIQKPIIDLSEAVALGKFEHVTTYGTAQKTSIEASPYQIRDTIKFGGQRPFPMEQNVCICLPKETGLDVYTSTHCITLTQHNVAKCLALPLNKVNIYTRRPGGSFGAKNSRGIIFVNMCAVAAHALSRPVRMNFDLESVLQIVGSRSPSEFIYDVGFDNEGKILSLDTTIHADNGCTSNERITNVFAALALQNVYSFQPPEAFKVKTVDANTNLPPNTFTRAPGYAKGIISMEHIMEHIAYTLEMDPLEVRLRNLMQKGDHLLFEGRVMEDDIYIPRMLEELKTSADIEDRKKFVNAFNAANRWKKRGLAIMLSRYPIHFPFSDYKVYVAVYGHDGTVAVTHSGVDMGQGLNTKVVQMVARELDVDMSKIRVKQDDSFVSANAAETVAGITSGVLCMSAQKACRILLARLAPVREKLGNPSWEELVKECKTLGMDLLAYASTTYEDGFKSFHVCGLGASEVEIDCLTGEYRIIRSDLILDGGKSINPKLDVGQLEGAFVMGLGYILTEKLVNDPNTGQLLTQRAWNYKIPTAKDVPEDFRVSLLTNVENPLGFLGSRTMSESPFSLSFSVILAMRQAIASARKECGNNDYFPMDIPIAPEDIQRLCLTDSSQFTD